MKKKLMMVAMLCGVLSLGACIDDTESQSVTNVRDSKTEELLSIAAMEKAEAAAKVALAQAEATLKAALAEAELAAAAKAEAMAEKARLQAELQELKNKQQELENEEARLENQKKQAELEAALAQEEVKKAQAEKELARIKAEMEQAAIDNEAALLAAELAMKQANEALNQATKNLEDAKTEAEREALEAERKKIQLIAKNYAKAVQELIDAKKTLNSYNSSLAYYTAALATAEDLQADFVASNNLEIAKKEMQIEKYKKYQNYTEDMDALWNLYDEVITDYNLAYDGYIAKYALYNDAFSAIDYTALDEAKAAIEENEFYKFVINGGMVSYKSYYGDGEYDYHDCSFMILTNDHYQAVNSWNPLQTTWGTLSYIPEGTESVYTYRVDSLEIYPEELNFDIRKVELYVDYELNAKNIALENRKNDSIYYQAQYDGKPFDWGPAGTDGKPTKVETGKPNAVDSTALAKAKYDKLVLDTDATDADKAAAKQEYEDCIAKEATLLSNIQDACYRIAYDRGHIYCMEKAWELYQNYDKNVAELEKAIEDYYKLALEAHADAFEAYKVAADAQVVWNELSAEYSALYTLLYNTVVDDNVNGEYNSMLGASAIASAIETLEDEIEALKEQNEVTSQYLADKEQAEEWIEKYKSWIIGQEAKVAAAEAKVAYTKAALDAVMAGEEVPEAPEGGEAEGGEEAAPAA